MKTKIYQSYPESELDGPDVISCVLCIMKNRNCMEWMQSHNTDCSKSNVIYLEIK